MDEIKVKLGGVARQAKIKDFFQTLKKMVEKQTPLEEIEAFIRKNLADYDFLQSSQAQIKLAKCLVDQAQNEEDPEKKSSKFQEAEELLTTELQNNPQDKYAINTLLELYFIQGKADMYATLVQVKAKYYALTERDKVYLMSFNCRTEKTKSEPIQVSTTFLELYSELNEALKPQNLDNSIVKAILNRILEEENLDPRIKASIKRLGEKLKSKRSDYIFGMREELQILQRKLKKAKYDQ